MNNYIFNNSALRDFENDNYQEEQEYQELIRVEAEVEQELKDNLTAR